MDRTREDPAKTACPLEPSGRALLEAAAAMMALAGGYRRPGVKLDLSRAQWVCGGEDAINQD